MTQPRRRRQGPVGLPSPATMPHHGEPSQLSIQPFSDLEQLNQPGRQRITVPAVQILQGELGDIGPHPGGRITRNHRGIPFSNIEHMYDTLRRRSDKKRPAIKQALAGRSCGQPAVVGSSISTTTLAPTKRS